MNRPRINEIFGMQSHANGYTIFSRLLTTDLRDRTMANDFCSESTINSKQAKEVFVPPSVTPRLSRWSVTQRPTSGSQLQRPGLLKQIIECCRSLEAQLGELAENEYALDDA